MSNSSIDGISEMHLPPVKKEWTMGNILSGLGSIATLLAFFVGGVFFVARLDSATKNIPDLVKTQAQMAQKQSEQATEIAVLQDQQRYTDMRYAEIMSQLASINQKLDKQAQEDAQHRH